jgi:hypothetical protein
VKADPDKKKRNARKWSRARMGGREGGAKVEFLLNIRVARKFRSAGYWISPVLDCLRDAIMESRYICLSWYYMYSVAA